MPGCSQLPQWVSYVQALAVPIFAALVGGLGVWIAARQMVIADEKLALDTFERLYDRRFAVYEATREILRTTFQGRFTQADTRSFGLRALDAQFLFDDAMYKYLHELHFHVEAYRVNKEKANDARPGEERKEFYRLAETNNAWLAQQGIKGAGIAERFAPYLTHKPPARPWLLRWP